MNSSPPPEPSLKTLLTNFKWTIDRFEEILQNDKTDYFRDAALQRFTFACNMATKCISSIAVEQGKTCKNFRECLEWFVEKNLPGKDTSWKELTESYARAALKLKGESADLEFEKLEAHCFLLKTIYTHLETFSSG
jgi:hypothetical protein